MRRTELRRTSAMRRGGRVKPKRATPRRREAPRWSAEEWEIANLDLMARSCGMCEMCGNPLNGSAERCHRVRRRDGGDSLAQLLLAHPGCHAWTHSNPLDARVMGFILRTTDDPLTFPVYWQGREWCLLADDGSRTPCAPPWAGAP